MQPGDEVTRTKMVITKKTKNFNIGYLKKTKITASSGLLLILKFAEEIGLLDELEKRFYQSGSHQTRSSTSLQRAGRCGKCHQRGEGGIRAG